MNTKEIRLPLHSGQTGTTSIRGLYKPGVLGREQPDGGRLSLWLPVGYQEEQCQERQHSCLWVSEELCVEVKSHLFYMAPEVELILAGGISWETMTSRGRRPIQSHDWDQQKWYGTELPSGMFKKGLDRQVIEDMPLTLGTYQKRELCILF